MKMLSPKNDVVFQLLFGKNQNKVILISFLNAILKDSIHEEIIDVTVKEKKIDVNMVIDEKISILDVYVETNNSTHINVEMQIVNEYNMIKRTLFYWSKMYLSQLVKGQDYELLNRTVTINILDFNFIESEKYHTIYHLTEDDSKEMLTDIMEINFIELKKFQKSSNSNNEKLERWLKFINDPNDKEVDEMAKVDKDIMKAQEILTLISSDEEAKQLAEMRQKAIMDKISFENAVKRKYRIEGREEGLKEGRKEGLKEGRKEGRIEGRISLLIKLLSMKLGEIPQDLIESINLLTEEQIDTISLNIFKYENLDDLYQALK